MRNDLIHVVRPIGGARRLDPGKSCPLEHSPNTMRILLDGRMWSYSGVGRYLQNLLAHIAPLDPTIEYVVLCQDETIPDHCPENVQFHRPSPRCPVYSLREQLWLPAIQRRVGAHLTHFPVFNIAPARGVPLVVTIHDIIYYRFRERSPNYLAYRYGRWMYHRVRRRADRVIVDSNFTRDELMHWCHFPPGLIEVIPLGVDARFHPIPKEEARRQVAGQFGLTQPFILSVGIEVPRKNRLLLLHAYLHLKARADRALVFAGREDPKHATVAEQVRRLGLESHVYLLGHVSDADLVSLYCAADLLAFPSVYEGFGLPPLEALACGTPVVCAEAAAVQEVVGDAALYAPVGDVEALQQAIDRLLDGDGLREELVGRGRERAQQFRWEKTAEATLHVYRHVLENRGTRK